MGEPARTRHSHEARLRAVRLVCEAGWRAADVATALGCSVRSVQLWIERSDRGTNPAALTARKPPGASPKLSDAQRTRLAELLDAGPEAAGLAGQLWTGPRVAALIEREFGVAHSSKYLPELLRRLGRSPQKPAKRAVEWDEEAIAGWVRTDWPRKKKSVGGSAPPSSGTRRPGS
ncbi:winged helix-turn-helix domain-containing protein [Alienimonas californiensis]|uniref:Winged helix-turn helix domain-containing protein n=1 Tax=Alienimonas californiensis TaxID=2527989 RepID=A0A517PBL0_9PLAN|nr:winged helix-turn-helix domain-containing protein [Alienimonas californiensis]QDT16763.1 hypothetical protein CA12_28700 [Alienimonas californiensis]